MKKFYFATAAIVLLLIQFNITYGQEWSNTGQPLPRSAFFVENKGQIHDQNKHSRSDIDFVLHGDGLNIFIGAGRISYQFAASNTKAKNKQPSPVSSIENRFETVAAPFQMPADTYTLYRLDMELSGANLNAHGQGELPSKAKFNYYLPGCGANGITDVQSWESIVYPEIYPGIDWVLYIKNNKLKYDFVLHEGASAQPIAILYKGATGQTLLADGSLEISTPLGKIKEEAPVAWTSTDRTPVAATFERRGEEWHFRIEPWKGALVLDPGLSWSTYYGGSGKEYATDVHAYNATVYITGLTTSLNQIATTGTHQNSYYGGIEGDAFLAKFASDGSLLWATYYGGESNDLAYRITTDGTGNVYMVGYTESGQGISTTSSHQPVSGGGECDAFLARFTSSGYRAWATYYGGTMADYGYSVTVDGSDLYICGLTYSNTNIGTPGSHQPAMTTYNGTIGNGFLTKWDLNGNRQWGTYYGSGLTTSTSVITDHDHYVYIAGSSTAPDGISTAGSHQSTLGGLYDNYLAKFNSGGQRQWGTYYGGTAAEGAFPVLLSADDNKLYLASYTYSYNQIATAGTSRSVYSNGIDGYLVSFNTNGVRNWGTYVGPGNVTNGVYIYDLAPGNCGEIYACGNIFPSAGLNTSEDAYQQTVGGGTFDGALLAYDQDGESTYCSYIGGALEDIVNAIARSDDGNLYLLGSTQSDAGIASTGAYQTTYGGGEADAFLMKFVDILPGDKANPDVINDTIHCINDTFVISFSVAAPFQTGNIFTAELSDNNGSFQNPLVIGTKSGTVSGYITCVVPQSVPPGNGYRVRINGSSPEVKGHCTMPLWLNLPAIPTIEVHGDTLVSSAAANYQWIRNSTIINGATNQKYVTTASGWHKVQVTDPVTGCKAYSDSVLIGGLGIDDINGLQSQIQVFPNPSSNRVNIDFAPSVVDLENYAISVITPSGRLIKTFSRVQYRNELDIRSLAGGIYFVEIKGPEGKAVFKIVKQ
jgi:hypothetical protein